MKPAAFYFILKMVITAFLAISTIAVADESGRFPGFSTHRYGDEQVVTFNYFPDIRVHINIAAAADFDPQKPVGLALFALPNGNSIEQTIGKIVQPEDNWHFGIQHIGAQTRFLRQQIDDYNLVTVYLEANQRSWPMWKSQHSNYAEIVKSLVEHLSSYFRDCDPFVILTGHSGGGRFIFSVLDAYPEIPNFVRRICFLDSNYGYEDIYGDQIIRWLNASDKNCLSVLAYNDSIALYNGKPFVSATGGTWYRSKMMQQYLSNTFEFSTTEDDDFIRHKALDGRIQILLKKNPGREIFHTVQVEKNGFIHTMLSGTATENAGYVYYGDRVYDDWIQPDALEYPNFQVPLRSPSAPGGSQFMDSLKQMSRDEKQAAILNELRKGNLPYFLRKLKTLELTTADGDGKMHRVKYRVMPDYLAVGSDSDYCRIPVTPAVAQQVANQFGATLPTRKLVDHIYREAEIKIAPVTYTPVERQNETIEKFVLHNSAIEQQRVEAGGVPGQLIAGHKKDVVLSNKIVDPARPNHVVIYGWHKLDGIRIQPLTNIHIDWYVDYSHGARLIDSEIFIDEERTTVQAVLRDPVLYKLLSDEDAPMLQPSYLPDDGIPSK